jgi:hypothetical protein
MFKWLCLQSQIISAMLVIIILLLNIQVPLELSSSQFLPFLVLYLSCKLPRLSSISSTQELDLCLGSISLLSNLGTLFEEVGWREFIAWNFLYSASTIFLFFVLHFLPSYTHTHTHTHTHTLSFFVVLRLNSGLPHAC